MFCPPLQNVTENEFLLCAHKWPKSKNRSSSGTGIRPRRADERQVPKMSCLNTGVEETNSKPQSRAWIIFLLSGAKQNGDMNFAFTKDKLHFSCLIQMNQWHLEAHWWRWLPLWKRNSYRIYVAQTVVACKKCSIKFPAFTAQDFSQMLTLFILRMKWMWKGKITALSKDSKHLGASDGWTEITVKHTSRTRKTLHSSVIVIPDDFSNDSLKRSC